MGEEGQSAACPPTCPALAWPGQEKASLMSPGWAPEDRGAERLFSIFRALSPDPLLLKHNTTSKEPRAKP